MLPAKYPPINPKCPHLLHGGDYNPDQWLHMPEVLAEDMRLMKLAGCNAMSVGIFSWSALEPAEGRFEFDWLDRVLDNLAATGVFAVLATPSGSKPAWLSQKYPEVCRCQESGHREPHAGRHNHCPTSPVYRDKVRIINTKLAERYAKHPALLLWHISNEYGGDCHCPLCKQAFRDWLARRYGSLDALNHAWWTRFWSHTYTDWSQIDFIDGSIHGLVLDWQRFVTDQTVAFMKHEIAPLRKLTPTIPVTTNLMGIYHGLNYWQFAPAVDVIAWDSYPGWHRTNADWQEAVNIAFTHDINRSLKAGQPFMLMESTPSTTNWAEVCKLKRPGMHRLASLQAVAHGADTVQYFQWRKSRGASEKFHGAVVDHCGHEHTRVFRDVADLGALLAKLDPIVGTTVRPEVGLIFDWENRWAINNAQGPRRDKGYEAACISQYRPFWKRGIPSDVINMDCDFSRYRLLIAPMLYMLRPGVAERIEQFVRAGGTFVATYWSGIVNESDLCFLGGFPGPLRKVLGIWAEEIDALWPDDQNTIMPGNYIAKEFCDLIHAETARVLATYQADFYAGRPALTENVFGDGKAYYIASRNDERFHDEFYAGLAHDLGLRRVLDTDLPVGVTAQLRTDGKREFVFLLNFTTARQELKLGPGKFHDLATGQPVTGTIELTGYAALVLERT